MRKIHFTDKYLLSPYHPVTVLVAGAGGTGYQVITSLARMSVALQALGHPGLHLTAFDPDTVTEANIGRQLFSETELGLNKATALVTRVNRFFGYAWEARECRYPIITKEGDKNVPLANIIITCTDNTRSRLDLWRFLKKYREYKNNDEKAPIYWMDFGNAQTTGQVLVGNIRSKISQPASSEYLPMPRMNVITEEVSYFTIVRRTQARVAHSRRRYASRICSSTPCWHKSVATSSGACSEKGGHSTGGPISTLTRYG